MISLFPVYCCCRISALESVMVLVMVVGMFIINGIQRFLKKREERAVAAAENARLMQAKH